MLQEFLTETITVNTITKLLEIIIFVSILRDSGSKFVLSLAVTKIMQVV